MPPKAGAKALAKAKAKGKAKALPRRARPAAAGIALPVRLRLRRPAAEQGEVPAEEVVLQEIGIAELLKVGALLVRGKYWDAPVEVVGVPKGYQEAEGEHYIRLEAREPPEVFKWEERQGGMASPMRQAVPKPPLEGRSDTHREGGEGRQRGARLDDQRNGCRGPLEEGTRGRRSG